MPKYEVYMTCRDVLEVEARNEWEAVRDAICEHNGDITAIQIDDVKQITPSSTLKAAE